jgi:hypothetical protein
MLAQQLRPWPKRHALPLTMGRGFVDMAFLAQLDDDGRLSLDRFMALIKGMRDELCDPTQSSRAAVSNAMAITRP